MIQAFLIITALAIVTRTFAQTKNKIIGIVKCSGDAGFSSAIIEFPPAEDAAFIKVFISIENEVVDIKANKIN